jgi:hypothetical protein
MAPEVSVGTVVSHCPSTNYGSHCILSCDNNYSPLSSSSPSTVSVTCTRDGLWVPDYSTTNGRDSNALAGLKGGVNNYLKCKPKVCDVLPAATGSLVTQCTNSNILGSECRFVCANGNELFGAQSVSCLEGGMWSERLPICVDLSTAVHASIGQQTYTPTSPNNCDGIFSFTGTPETSYRISLPEHASTQDISIEVLEQSQSVPHNLIREGSQQLIWICTTDHPIFIIVRQHTHRQECSPIQLLVTEIKEGTQPRSSFSLPSNGQTGTAFIPCSGVARKVWFKFQAVSDEIIKISLWPRLPLRSVIAHFIDSDEVSVMEASSTEIENTGRGSGSPDGVHLTWKCSRSGSYYVVVEGENDQCGPFVFGAETTQDCFLAPQSSSPSL